MGLLTLFYVQASKLSTQKQTSTKKIEELSPTTKKDKAMTKSEEQDKSQKQRRFSFRFKSSVKRSSQEKKFCESTQQKPSPKKDSVAKNSSKSLLKLGNVFASKKKNTGKVKKEVLSTPSHIERKLEIDPNETMSKIKSKKTTPAKGLETKPKKLFSSLKKVLRCVAARKFIKKSL